jgi:hypothetical protein
LAGLYGGFIQMSVTMTEIEEVFEIAKEEGSTHVAVEIEMEGFPANELILNPSENIDTKLAYYKKTYDENGNHRFAPGIRIVSVYHGTYYMGDEDEVIN